MNTIVTWVWTGERTYTLEHAAALSKMLRRHMKSEYRFVVIADKPGHVPDATCIKTPAASLELANLRTIESRAFPTSFRRLWLFSEEARELGDVVLCTDLDVVVTDDWTHLFEYQAKAPFMGWMPGQRWGNQEKRVGGGTWRLRTGFHTEVWTNFVADPEAAKKEARAAGYRGSDQAWISYNLAEKVPVWPKSAGICSVRDFTRDNRSKVVPEIPEGICVVHFNGHNKPWMPQGLEQHPWIAEYWPKEEARDPGALRQLLC